MKRVHVIISGQVQGVFYRTDTSEAAQRLGLKGWVRNIESGKVEIVAEGEKEALEELIAWCKAGSSLARVESVEVAWEKPSEEFSMFDIRY